MSGNLCLGGVDLDWDEDFQTIIDQTQEGDDYTISETDLSLSDLAKEFEHLSTLYGKVIISERNLPIKERTFKPIGGLGIAGGDKYIVGKIFFKFALDPQLLTKERSLSSTQNLFVSSQGQQEPESDDNLSPKIHGNLNSASPSQPETKPNSRKFLGNTITSGILPSESLSHANDTINNLSNEEDNTDNNNTKKKKLKGIVGKVDDPNFITIGNMSFNDEMLDEILGELDFDTPKLRDTKRYSKNDITPPNDSKSTEILNDGGEIVPNTTERNTSPSSSAEKNNNNPSIDDVINVNQDNEDSMSIKNDKKVKEDKPNTIQDALIDSHLNTEENPYATGLMGDNNVDTDDVNLEHESDNDNINVSNSNHEEENPYTAGLMGEIQENPYTAGLMGDNNEDHTNLQELQFDIDFREDFNETNSVQPHQEEEEKNPYTAGLMGDIQENPYTVGLMGDIQVSEDFNDEAQQEQVEEENPYAAGLLGDIQVDEDFNDEPDIKLPQQEEENENPYTVGLLGDSVGIIENREEIDTDNPYTTALMGDNEVNEDHNEIHTKPQQQQQTNNAYTAALLGNVSLNDDMLDELIGNMSFNSFPDLNLNESEKESFNQWKEQENHNDNPYTTALMENTDEINQQLNEDNETTELLINNDNSNEQSNENPMDPLETQNVINNNETLHQSSEREEIDTSNPYTTALMADDTYVNEDYENPYTTNLLSSTIDVDQIIQETNQISIQVLGNSTGESFSNEEFFDSNSSSFAGLDILQSTMVSSFISNDSFDEFNGSNSSALITEDENDDDSPYTTMLMTDSKDTINNDDDFNESNSSLVITENDIALMIDDSRETIGDDEFYESNSSIVLPDDIVSGNQSFDELNEDNLRKFELSSSNVSSSPTSCRNNTETTSSTSSEHVKEKEESSAEEAIYIENTKEEIRLLRETRKRNRARSKSSIPTVKGKEKFPFTTSSDEIGIINLEEINKPTLKASKALSTSSTEEKNGRLASFLNEKQNSKESLPTTKSKRKKRSPRKRSSSNNFDEKSNNIGKLATSLSSTLLTETKKASAKITINRRGSEYGVIHEEKEQRSFKKLVNHLPRALFSDKSMKRKRSKSSTSNEDDSVITDDDHPTSDEGFDDFGLSPILKRKRSKSNASAEENNNISPFSKISSKKPSLSNPFLCNITKKENKSPTSSPPMVPRNRNNLRRSQSNTSLAAAQKDQLHQNDDSGEYILAQVQRVDTLFNNDTVLKLPPISRKRSKSNAAIQHQQQEVIDINVKNHPQSNYSKPSTSSPSSEKKSQKKRKRSTSYEDEEHKKVSSKKPSSSNPILCNINTQKPSSPSSSSSSHNKNENIKNNRTNKRNNLRRSQSNSSLASQKDKLVQNDDNNQKQHVKKKRSSSNSSTVKGLTNNDNNPSPLLTNEPIKKSPRKQKLAEENISNPGTVHSKTSTKDTKPSSSSTRKKRKLKRSNSFQESDHKKIKSGKKSSSSNPSLDDMNLQCKKASSSSRRRKSFRTNLPTIGIENDNNEEKHKKVSQKYPESNPMLNKRTKNELSINKKRKPTTRTLSNEEKLKKKPYAISSDTVSAKKTTSLKTKKKSPRTRNKMGNTDTRDNHHQENIKNTEKRIEFNDKVTITTTIGNKSFDSSLNDSHGDDNDDLEELENNGSKTQEISIERRRKRSRSSVVPNILSPSSPLHKHTVVLHEEKKINESKNFHFRIHPNGPSLITPRRRSNPRIVQNSDSSCRKYMYGGSVPNDIAAMKTATNEMKGLMACYNCSVKDLHFPLLCTIDYKGYRLTAMSVLRIKRGETIKYGSENAKQVHKDDIFTPKMKEIAQKLNLRKHKVNNKQGNEIQPISIYGPLDIEGHEINNKFYLIDFARIFPPEMNENGRPLEIYYNLFRPEFLKSYEKPLSSDALSGFEHKSEQEISKNEILHATVKLRRDNIIKFSKKMIQIIKKDENIENLTELIHSFGINCRHLGRIRDKIDNLKEEECMIEDDDDDDKEEKNKTNNEEEDEEEADLDENHKRKTKTYNFDELKRKAKEICLSEIVARMLKTIFKHLQRHYINFNEKELAHSMLNNLLNEKSIKYNNNIDILNNKSKEFNEFQRLSIIKTIKSFPVTEQNKNEIITPVGQLFDIFGVNLDSFKNNLFWKYHLSLLIQHFYIRCFNSMNELKFNNIEDIRNIVNKETTFSRLCKLCGIKVRKNVLKEYNNNPKSFQLMLFDIKKLSVRVRRMNIFEKASIKIFYQELKKEMNFNPNTEKWDSFYDLLKNLLSRTVESKEKMNYCYTLISARLKEISGNYKFISFDHNNNKTTTTTTRTTNTNSTSGNKSVSSNLNKSLTSEEYLKSRIEMSFIDLSLDLKSLENTFFTNQENSFFYFFKGKIELEKGLFHIFLCFKTITSSDNKDQINTNIIKAICRFNNALFYFKKLLSSNNENANNNNNNNTDDDFLYEKNIDFYFNSLIKKARKYYRDAKTCNHKISCSHHKLFLLRAFFIQYLILKAKSTNFDQENQQNKYKKDNIIFYRSLYFSTAFYLTEYLKRDGFDEYYLFSGILGSFLEIILVEFPYLYDGKEFYHFKPSLWFDQRLPRKIYTFKCSSLSNYQSISIHKDKNLMDSFFMTSNSCALHFIPVLNSNSILFDHQNMNMLSNDKDNQILRLYQNIFKLLYQSESMNEFAFTLDENTNEFSLILSSFSYFILSEFIIGFKHDSELPIDIKFIFSDELNDKIDNEIIIFKHFNVGKNTRTIKCENSCKYHFSIIIYYYY